MNDDNFATDVTVRPRKKGCVLKGCLTLLIVLMLMGVIFGVFGTYITRGLKPFFSPDPVAVRIYPATDLQYQALLARMEPFNQAMSAGVQATLDLTAEDIDVLIAREPAAANTKGKLYLEIQDNELMADVSTPFHDYFSRPAGYFTGRLLLQASIADGEFSGVVRQLKTLDGVPISGLLARFIPSRAFMDGFNDGVNQAIEDRPALAGYLRRVRTITIENNHFHLTSKGEPVKPATPTPTTPTPASTTTPPTPAAAAPTATPAPSPDATAAPVASVAAPPAPE